MPLITEGLLDGDLLLQGFDAAPASAAGGNIITQGFGSGGLLTQGFSIAPEPVIPAEIFTAVLGQLTMTSTPYLMASTSTLPLAADFAGLLLEDETLSAPVVTLTDLGAYAAYSAGLTGATTLDGTRIIRTVTGLLPGKMYRLAFSGQVAVGKVWSREARIYCPW